ncbi:MAG: Fic family protein [Anaerosomatales bacterium]|nr:Fic family protein [Anaerosomatales bacterium]
MISRKEVSMYRYRLTPYLIEELEGLDALRAGLTCNGALPRRWLGRLRREWEAGVVAASTRIEGVPVTVDDVRRILAGDRPAWVCEHDCGLVEGYGEAVEYALRRADDDAFRWTRKFVLQVHLRVMGVHPDPAAGSFRYKDVWLGDSGSGGVAYVPPPPREVPGLVDELCEWAQSSTDPAPVVAALVHARLAGIHPFYDGNGRVARILASVAMRRGGYNTQEFVSLEEWWGSHREEYYDAFKDLGHCWNPDADVTRFVTIHVRAQRRQVEAFWLKQAVECEIWGLAEGIAEEILEQPPRLAEALFDGFFGRPVTNRYYRSLVGITGRQATADLTLLTERRLLARVFDQPEEVLTGAFALISAVASAAGVGLAPEAGSSVDQQRAHVVTAIAERIERERAG